MRRVRAFKDFLFGLCVVGVALLPPVAAFAQTPDASAWPGRPAFENMPCAQRREQVLQFWGTLPRQPDACARARKTLAVAQDLVATKRACGETADWRTVETDQSVTEHAAAARAACGNGGSSLRRQAAGDAGRAAGCPMDITANGRRVSIIDPIEAQGGAANALRAARQTLAGINSQGSCSDFGSERQTCEENLRVWQDTVRALECHAAAEERQPPAVPGKAGGASGDRPGSPPAAAAKDANAFLGFGDKTGAKGDGGAGASGGKGGAAGRGAAAFLPFADGNGSGSGGGTESAFPTPFCRFVSDEKERHDPETQVCVGKTVYICLGRSSPRGADAWHVVGTSGCGSVRSIRAVEDARRADRQRTKIHED